ncbi:hypothetical protein YC2023_065400 [Brassica napus]
MCSVSGFDVTGATTTSSSLILQQLHEGKKLRFTLCKTLSVNEHYIVSTFSWRRDDDDEKFQQEKPRKETIKLCEFVFQTERLCLTGDRRKQYKSCLNCIFKSPIIMLTKPPYLLQTDSKPLVLQLPGNQHLHSKDMEASKVLNKVVNKPSVLYPPGTKKTHSVESK